VVLKAIEYILHVHMQMFMSIIQRRLSHSMNGNPEIVFPDFRAPY